MLVLSERPTAFFDVDETLVLWRRPPGPSIEGFDIATEFGGMFVWRHEAHIERLKNHYRLGHQIIVWSHGGVDWAKRVVNALDLADYVHVVCNKGDWFYDDKADEIITKYTQRYIPPEDSQNV